MFPALLTLKTRGERLARLTLLFSLVLATDCMVVTARRKPEPAPAPEMY